jgi:hypothetical protein
VGLRPLVCFAKCRYYTTVLSFLIYAGKGVKDKRRSREQRTTEPRVEQAFSPALTSAI